MANTLELGNGKWATGKDTVLAFNDENNNFKPLPFDFSRASSGTIVNQQGLIETVGSGEPRIDFKDDAKGALKLEPQSNNLVTYSEDFSNAAWTGGGSITISGGYLAPDGSDNAYKVSGSGGALNGGFGLIESTTRSIYARTVSGAGKISLLSYFGNSNNLFDITEEWQRFEVSTSISTGSNSFYAVDFRSLSATLSEVIIWGANATNDQSYATSYIPTQGSVVTRSADVCNNGANEQVINSTEGVLYAEISALANDGEQGRISLSNKSLNNRVSFAYSPTESKAYIIVKLNSTTIINNLNVEIGNHLDTKKIAISYKSGDTKVYLNGVEILTSSVSFTGGVLNDLSFTSATNSLPLYAKTKDLRIYNTALTNAELQALTT